LGSILINLDNVEGLGNFIEFEALKEKDCSKIYSLVKKLGLNMRNSTKLTYFELALANTSPTQKLFVKIHDKFGRFVYGISSAVLTTLGIMIGLNSATASLTAVIGGIVAVAISDSLSDSMGIYTSKKSERGISDSTAFKSALNTFFGKLVFTLTFIIPFIFFPILTAIYVCVIWGLILLSFISIQIAFVQQESMLKTIVKNIAFATIIIIISYFVGELVAFIT